MGHYWDNTNFIETFLSQFKLVICKTLRHRGKILENKLRSMGVNLTKLADKLPWSTKTIYRHFTEENLPYEKIAQYAKATKHQFVEEFPEMEVGSYKELKDIPVHKEISDPDYYRLKYETLLEKYNGLLEQHNAVLIKFLSKENNDVIGLLPDQSSSE